MDIEVQTFNEHFPDEITRAQVQSLATAGIPHALIAEIVELSEDTLNKHYKKELKFSTPIAVARIAGTLYQQALNGDTKAAVQYLKMKGAQYGWVEKQVVEVTADTKETKELEQRVLELEAQHVRDY